METLYKSPDNKVHSLPSAEFEYLLPAGCIRITEAEADAIRNPPLPLNEVAQLKAAYLKDRFAAVLDAGFVCVNGIAMDATNDDIRMLDDGWRLAIRLGAASMDIRDFNNVRHMGVLLADVEAMVNELGANWLAQWTRKCERDESVQAIVAANALPPSDPSYMDDTTARAAIESITW